MYRDTLAVMEIHPGMRKFVQCINSRVDQHQGDSNKGHGGQNHRGIASQNGIEGKAADARRSKRFPWLRCRQRAAGNQSGGKETKCRRH